MADLIGFHAVRECLIESPHKARCLYLLRGRRDARANELIILAKSQKVRFQSVEPFWFDRRGVAGNYQNVLLDCHEVAVESENDLKAKWESFPSDVKVLVLDEIADPRNLGACLRSANGAGVEVVVLPKRKSAPLSEAALKVAQGGNEGLCIVEVVNLARFLGWLKSKGVMIYGATADAHNSWTTIDGSGPLAVIVGNENKGIRRLTKDKCDHLVKINMQGSVDSLNVSVACGVMLFEILRQREL